MLKLFFPLLTLTALAVTPALAGSQPTFHERAAARQELQDTRDEHCRIQGTFAASAANLRETGVLLTKAMAVASSRDGGVSPEAITLMRSLVLFAYKKTWLTPLEIQQRVEVACFAGEELF